MEPAGRRVVLAATTSESSEYRHSAWRQMALATLPERYARLTRANVSSEAEKAGDGQARYVPQGLRVIESVLLDQFPAADIAVCHEDEFDRFVGDATRVVGVHVHNPLGLTFATDMYTQLYGGGLDPINWFPICTWMLGLPGETDEDTRQTLDLLYALKDAKWVVIPTLFVPLEWTRLERSEGAQIPRTTDLQWELFYTCWRYNMELHGTDRLWRMVRLGVPLYHLTLGRRLFGSRIKYPLLRLWRCPERLLRNRLYLDFSGAHESRLCAPEGVPIAPQL
jgi:hypothetical protein